MDQHLFKTCTTCAVSKSLYEFHKNKKGKFGHNSICKSCIREKYCKRAAAAEMETEVEVNAEIVTQPEKCIECGECGEFYENPTSRTGFMKICRYCYGSLQEPLKEGKALRYIRRDQSDTLTISEYAASLLRQFQRKYSKKTIHVTSREIAELWNQQRGLCAITGHPMILEKDASGKIDNVWNMTLFFKNSGQKIITSDNIILVCHLIRTMERKYGFTLDKMRDIYRELIG